MKEVYTGLLGGAQLRGRIREFYLRLIWLLRLHDFPMTQFYYLSNVQLIE